MRKAQFIRSIGTALVLLLLVVFPVAAKTTVTHWHNSYTHENVLIYLEEMKALFEAANPDIIIELSTVQGGEYAGKLITSVAANVGPDVAQWYIADETFEMVKNGMFLDLNPYMERDHIDTGEFIPIAMETYRWEGMLWGFPYSGYPFMTFYNPQLFEEAGLVGPAQLGDEWTWDEAARAGKLLTVQSPGAEAPTQYGLQFRFDNIARMSIWVHQAGGSFFDSMINPTESKFMSPESVRAVSWVNDMQRSGIVSPTTSYDELITDTTGVVLHGGPYIFGLQSFQPVPGHLTTPIGVADMPRGPEHSGTVFNSDAWMIMSSSKEKDAAWKWMKFIGMDEQRASRFSQLTGRVPTVIRALPTYVDLLPQGVMNGLAIVEATIAPTTAMGALQSSVAWDINRTFRTHMANVRAGNDSPEGALTKIHQEVTLKLEQANQ